MSLSAKIKALALKHGVPSAVVSFVADAVEAGGDILAAAVAYTAGVPGNYVVAPTTAQGALDSLAAQGKLFSLDLTLVAGTKTLASGKDLTNATLLSCTLKTPNTACGAPVVTFVAGANGNVTVTSKTDAAATATTDVSTYTCVFAGAV